MPLVYVDNFRGFEDTFIPLKKANFFVGENSTGKTSILKLIKILSQPQFWFFDRFHSDDAHLGHFNEIISKTSQNRKNFKVGILSDFDSEENNLSATLIKFTENNGKAFPSEINMLLKNVILHAVVSKKGDNNFKYRYRKVDIKNLNEKNKKSYFKLWLNKDPLKGYRYTYLENNESFRYPSNLIRAFSVLKEKVLELNEDKDLQLKDPIPSFLRDITWMAPIREKPKRTYDSYESDFSPEGAHSPYLLRKMYDNKRSYSEFIDKLEGFGIKSGLFKGIGVKLLGDDSKTAPFEIYIDLGHSSYKLPNVGYGLSQILPILVEIVASPEGEWFSIQQPEIHIHPKAQSAFGEFIYNSMKSDHKKFIIETHSDFIIDRFRFKMHQSQTKESDRDINHINSQVLFFQRTEKGNCIECIPILTSGKYSESQSSNFRDFFINEDLNTIQI